MKIAGIQKLSLLDFPGVTAATIFTQGCNYRCPFCHNGDLVPSQGEPPLPLDSLFDFLRKRQGLLDGLCISGGEPLLQPKLEDFCQQVKDLGYQIKLDTNGSMPERLLSMIDKELVDYVALDIKNSPRLYARTIGLDVFDCDCIETSMTVLKESGIDYELRTTVVAELHSKESLLELAEWIQGARCWYLQNFVDSASVLAGTGMLHPFDEAEIIALLPPLRNLVPQTQLRGFSL